ARGGPAPAASGARLRGRPLRRHRPRRRGRLDPGDAAALSDPAGGAGRGARAHTEPRVLSGFGAINARGGRQSPAAPSIFRHLEPEPPVPSVLALHRHPSPSSRAARRSSRASHHLTLPDPRPKIPAVVQFLNNRIVFLDGRSCPVRSASPIRPIPTTRSCSTA